MRILFFATIIGMLVFYGFMTLMTHAEKTMNRAMDARLKSLE